MPDQAIYQKKVEPGKKKLDRNNGLQSQVLRQNGTNNRQKEESKLTR
jgi:hypothetical protein